MRKETEEDKENFKQVEINMNSAQFYTVIITIILEVEKVIDDHYNNQTCQGVQCTFFFPNQETPFSINVFWNIRFKYEHTLPLNLYSLFQIV